MWEAVGILFKWLNRRSQRKSFTWEQFKRFIQRHPLPRVRVFRCSEAIGLVKGFIFSLLPE